MDEPETKSSIGALYEHHNPSKPYVGTYPIVFLLRRSFFVLTTFALYKLPCLQAQLMLSLTLAYLCYISRQRFYESPFQRRVEMCNEGLLICLCTHFILFTDIALQQQQDESLMVALGRSACIFVLILLGGNTAIILAINFRSIKLKVKRKLNERAAKRRAEELRAIR